MCITGVDPGFFLGGGALVSCSTSTPINHIVFFCRIPVILENCRSSLVNPLSPNGDQHQFSPHDILTM